MNRILVAVLCFVALYLSNSCSSPLDNKLNGKKLYRLSLSVKSIQSTLGHIPGTLKLTTVLETEFHFISDSLVKISLTDAFIDYEQELFLEALNLENNEFSPREFQYQYNDGILKISELGLAPTQIKEHDNLYSTVDGETFYIYNESIATLSKAEKRNRISKFINLNDEDLDKLVESEILISDLIEAHEKLMIEALGIERSVATSKRIMEDIDSKESIDNYVILYDDPNLYKTDGKTWPDQEQIDRIYYVITDKNQILAITEVPFSQSGDWYMSITHYFNTSGKTIATERIFNEFFRDAGDDFYIPGQLYKHRLIKFFDANQHVIKEEYRITDGNDNEKANPYSYYKLDGLEDYEDFQNRTFLLKTRKLNLSGAVAFPKNIKDLSNQTKTTRDGVLLIEEVEVQQPPKDNAPGFESVEIPPTPPQGTLDGFRNWFAGVYQLPAEAVETNASGFLEVSFVIDKDGSLIDFKIIKDFGYGTGEAAIETLKKSSKWKPGVQNGRPVKVMYTFPYAVYNPNALYKGRQKDTL